jgi:hypothetical protein
METSHTEVHVGNWQGNRAGRWLSAVVLVAACADTGGGTLILVGAPADAGVSGSAEPDGGTAELGDADAADVLDGGETSLDAELPDAQTPADGGAEDPGVDAATAALLTCVPGVYRGAFSGQVGFLPGLLGSLASTSIRGNIVIRVSVASAGSLLVVEQGSVTGSDQEGNPLSAVVSGVLDCATGTLRSGKLSDGRYRRGTSDVTFAGDVSATYTAGPPTLTGTWTISSGLDGGSGAFSAVLSAEQ